MKKIKENIELGFVVFIGFIFVILTFSSILLTFPFTYYKRKKFEKRYSEFLERNSNRNFFCYNNRINSKEFIETEIIPYLNSKIEIVYLNGRYVENRHYPVEFLSRALYSFKNYSKFPHLMKIRNGQLIDKSINSLFYSIKDQNKPKDKLLREVNDFFELN